MSGANADMEIFIFPVQLTTSRIDNLIRLIHTLLFISDDHISIRVSQHKNGTGSAVPSHISILRLNLVLTYRILLDFSMGVHLFFYNRHTPSGGSVPSLSGHAIACRWRSLPRVRRYRASKPQGSSERVLLLAGHNRPINMCVCVCVFFPSILDIKFVGCTSRGHTGGRSHRIFNPPSFCGACLDFCREKDSAIPFPRRP